MMISALPVGYFDMMDFWTFQRPIARGSAGPLKDMEGKITKVDRRGRSGQGTVKFDKRDIKLWLEFDSIEKPFDIDREYSFEKKSKVSNVCRGLHPYKLRMI